MHGWCATPTQRAARSATAIASIENSSPRGSVITGVERTGGLPGTNSSNSEFSTPNAVASAN